MGAMPEITIQFGHVAENGIASKDDYHKIVQDMYTDTYLANLGVEPTSENKAMVNRHAPLGQCTIEASWTEFSAVASSLRVVQPHLGAKRSDEFEDYENTDRKVLDGKDLMEYRSVLAPAGADARAIEQQRGQEQDQKLNAANAARVVLREKTLATMRYASWRASVDQNTGLTEELERMRRRVEPAPPDAEADTQQMREALDAELQLLKRKFIMPFACERPRAAGQGAVVALWESPELQSAVREIEVPKALLEEVAQPISRTLDQIKDEAARYAANRMPLELLTARRDADLFPAVREQLASSEMVRLTGLLSHLLYWDLFGHLHKPARRMTESSRHSLLVTVHDLWTSLLTMYRETPVGVSFVLPVLLLSMKRGVEDCFFSQYPKFFEKVEELRTASSCTGFGPAVQRLIDHINVTFMSLFNPDGNHFSFAALDSSKGAIRLWRKVSVIQTALGRDQCARHLAKVERTSTVMQTLMGDGCATSADPKTRRLLAKSSSDTALHRGSARSGHAPESGLQPGDWRQAVLYRTARRRLSHSGRQVVAEGRPSSVQTDEARGASSRRANSRAVARPWTVP